MVRVLGWDLRHPGPSPSSTSSNSLGEFEPVTDFQLDLPHWTVLMIKQREEKPKPTELNGEVVWIINLV